tara:strand:- start:211 stop:534 length:324 start_codon:yes stop_codon:yes gene_type:complete
MSSIVSDYYDSTKSISIALIIALVLTLIANFLPSVNESFFRCNALKIIIITCLGYTIYNIISNSLPIIGKHKLDLLRDSLTDIRKCITYNVVLVIFILLLAYDVIFI